MEASEREQPLRARERPLREAGSIEKRDCGEPGGIDPGAEKSALGERNGETPGASQCIALCRACRWRARLGIGSLGTTSFLSTPPCPYHFTRSFAGPFGPPPWGLSKGVCRRGKRLRDLAGRVSNVHFEDVPRGEPQVGSESDCTPTRRRPLGGHVAIHKLSECLASALRVWSVRPIFFPSISPTGNKLRVVDVMKTSSALSRSAGVRFFSAIRIPGTWISPRSTSRVMPGRQPELTGGVHTWPPVEAKMLADVHSATSPCSFSRITSSSPRCCARFHPGQIHRPGENLGSGELAGRVAAHASR